MIVNQYRLAIDVGAVVTGEMDFADRVARQAVQIGVPVEAEILRGYMDIIEVAQDGASGAPHQRREKVGFVDR